MANFERGKMVAQAPMDVPIFRGCRILLTKNLNKSIGFVNGMGAVVLGLDGGNIVVRTDQGVRLAVHLWTSEDRFAHFPLRLAWLCKHTAQGAGSHVAAHHAVARCRQHAGYGLRCPRPRRVRRQLAFCGRPRHPPLHAGPLPLRAGLACSFHSFVAKSRRSPACSNLACDVLRVSLQSKASLRLVASRAPIEGCCFRGKEPLVARSSSTGPPFWFPGQ